MENKFKAIKGRLTYPLTSTVCEEKALFNFDILSDDEERYDKIIEAIKENQELYNSGKVETLVEIMECFKYLNDEMLLNRTDNIEITFKSVPLFRIKQKLNVSQGRSAYLDMYLYDKDLKETEEIEKSSFFNFFW